MLLSRLVVSISVGGLMAVGAGVISGQDYPNKPIRIVTSSVGGGSDFDARQIARGISDPLGQLVVVDNRASAALAAQAVIKAPPDGYTLTMQGSNYWLIPLLRKVNYDVADLSPISLIETSVSVVVVHPSLPVKSIKELITLAKARPGELNFSAGNPGGQAQLSGELFKAMAGVKIVIVPYKNASQETADLLGGHVQATIGSAVVVLGPAKAGKLRALAVTSLKPTALAPGLPTVAASGLPGYEAVSMTALFAPAKTSRTIINRLNQEIVRFLNKAEVKETFFNNGVDIVGSSPEELTATIKSDMVKWGKVINDAGIKID